MMSKSLIQTYERYGRWAPPAAAALLAWLVGSALAQLAWQLVPTPQAGRWHAPPAAPASEARGHGPDIGAIAMASLFGRYAPPQNLAAQALLAAPDTHLDLTLIGILADKNSKGSRALIADSGGDQKPYAVGDLVARNALVQAIFQDRVILSREGRLETLRLDKESPGGGFTPSGVQPAGFDAPGNSAADSVAQLAEVREQILTDPTKAGNYIRIQPNQASGQLHGYRVYPGPNRAAFAAAGLRPGDLVTSVNGVELDDPTKALQMLGDLSKATQLSLTVERGGQTQYINLSLE